MMEGIRIKREPMSSRYLGRIARKELTLAERIAIIKEADGGQRVSQIANTFSINKQQIRRILKRRNQYLTLWAKSQENEIDTVRRLRCPLMLSTNAILYEWITRGRYYMDITDDILRSTGRVIADHLRYRFFKSNNRWLNRFKQKYKLHTMRLTGLSKGNVDPKNLKSLNLPEIMEDMRQELKLPDYDEIRKHMEMNEDDDDNGYVAEPNNSSYSVMDDENYEQNSSSSKQDHGIEMEDGDYSSEIGEFENNGNDIETAKEITSYREAINSLGPIEQFALLKENIRAVGLINQLENLFREEMRKSGEN